MEQKSSQTHKFEIKNFKDVYDYCYLNGIMDINSFVNECFKKGFNIEKYGLIGQDETKIVEKIVEVPVDREVIVEKIVEKIIEVPVDREVIVEKIVEVPVENSIKNEVIVEKEVPVEKIVYITNSDDNKEEKLKLLQNTLLNLKKDLSLKDEKIKELENKLKELEKLNKGAVFLKGSNLNQRL